MNVIDASVAIKWFVDEIDSVRALHILTEIQEKPLLFAVPDFFFIEMMSVLSRIEKDATKLKNYLTDLEDLGISRIGIGHSILMDSAEIAHKTKISGYDAFYAATAKSLGGVWVTADRKAHEKVASLKISRLL